MAQTLKDKRAAARERMRERRRDAGFRESERQQKRSPEGREAQRGYQAKYSLSRQGPEWRKIRNDVQNARRQRRRAELLNRQQGLCYLCDEPVDPDKFTVDHDNSCCPGGKNSDGSLRGCARCRRGVTHPACNVLIALAGDDPARLRLIADNLEAAQSFMAGLPYQATLGF